MKTYKTVKPKIQAALIIASKLTKEKKFKLACYDKIILRGVWQVSGNIYSPFFWYEKTGFADDSGNEWYMYKDEKVTHGFILERVIKS